MEVTSLKLMALEATALEIMDQKLTGLEDIKMALDAMASKVIRNTSEDIKKALEVNMKVSVVMVSVFTLAKGRLMLNHSSDMESEDKESEVSEDTEVDSEISEVSGSKVSAMVNDRLTLNLSSEDTEAVSEVSVTATESAKPILKDSSKTKQEKLSKKKVLQQ